MWSNSDTRLKNSTFSISTFYPSYWHTCEIGKKGCIPSRIMNKKFIMYILICFYAAVCNKIPFTNQEFSAEVWTFSFSIAYEEIHAVPCVSLHVSVCNQLLPICSWSLLLQHKILHRFDYSWYASSVAVSWSPVIFVLWTASYYCLSLPITLTVKPQFCISFLFSEQEHCCPILFYFTYCRV